MKFKLVIEGRDDVVAKEAKGFDTAVIKSERKGFDPVFVEGSKLYVLANELFGYSYNKASTYIFMSDANGRVAVRIKGSIDDYKLEVKYGSTYKVYEKF